MGQLINIQKGLSIRSIFCCGLFLANPLDPFFTHAALNFTQKVKTRPVTLNTNAKTRAVVISGWIAIDGGGRV